MTPNEQVVDLIKRMKGEMRSVINNYATECSKLAVIADPHSPVLSACQIAFANASVDYMVLCGATPTEALQTVTNVTGIAMQHWLETITRLHKVNAEIKGSTIEINNTPTVPTLN